MHLALIILSILKKVAFSLEGWLQELGNKLPKDGRIIYYEMQMEWRKMENIKLNKSKRLKSVSNQFISKVKYFYAVKIYKYRLNLLLIMLNLLACTNCLCYRPILTGMPPSTKSPTASRAASSVFQDKQKMMENRQSQNFSQASREQG